MIFFFIFLFLIKNYSRIISDAGNSTLTTEVLTRTGLVILVRFYLFLHDTLKKAYFRKAGIFT